MKTIFKFFFFFHIFIIYSKKKEILVRGHLDRAIKDPFKLAIPYSSILLLLKIKFSVKKIRFFKCLKIKKDKSIK
jgi:hypothetical protein